MDLGDHHKWIAVEKLEPTTLIMDEGGGAKPVEENEANAAKRKWFRRSIRNRMSMPNR